jgi:glycine dehydrogenase subunit 2
MRAIAKEVDETPELVKSAPHSTRVSRLDEVQAARKPILRWRPADPLPPQPIASCDPENLPTA